MSPSSELQLSARVGKKQLLSTPRSTDDSDDSGDDIPEKDGLPELVPFMQNGSALLLVRLISFWDRKGSRDMLVFLRISHAVFVYVGGVTLQIVLAAFLLLSIERMGVTFEPRKFSPKFGFEVIDAVHYMESAVANGSNATLPVVFQGADGILSMCVDELGCRYPLFYYLMAIVWNLNVITHIQDGVIQARKFLFVPRRLPGQRIQMEEGKLVVIKCLDAWMKVTCLIVVTVPRMVLALTLGWAGTSFIVLQNKAFTIVVKCMIMTFVFTLDANFFHATVPPAARQRLDKSRIETTLPPIPRDSLWETGVGGIFNFVVCLLIVWFSIDIFYGDLMHFRKACKSYNDSFHIDGVQIPMGFKAAFAEMFTPV